MLTVPVDELRGRYALRLTALPDQRVESVRTSDDPRVDVTQDGGKALVSLFSASGSGQECVMNAAKEQQISPRTIYRWSHRYREVATTRSLRDMTPGPAIGRRRMDAVRDTLLRELIDEHYLKPARLSPEAIYREAGYRREARTAASRWQFTIGRVRQILLRGGGEQA
jgi:hypothetical protein